MLKVIRGRKYNTATAHEVGYETVEEGYGYVNRTLYRKRTGEYFLAVEYNYMVDGVDPDYIKPLTGEEASEWAQEHLDVDTYEKEFGEVVEDRTSVAMTLNLPRQEYEKLKGLALDAGMPVSKYLTKVIKRIK